MNTMIKADKLLDEITKYSHQAGLECFGWTRENIERRYNEIKAERGEIAAWKVAENQLAILKEKAKEERKRLLNRIRRYFLRTRGSVPTGRRDIEEILKTCSDSIPSIREYKRRFME